MCELFTVWKMCSLHKQKPQNTGYVANAVLQAKFDLCHVCHLWLFREGKFMYNLQKERKGCEWCVADVHVRRSLKTQGMLLMQFCRLKLIFVNCYCAERANPCVTCKGRRGVVQLLRTFNFLWQLSSQPSIFPKWGLGQCQLVAQFSICLFFTYVIRNSKVLNDETGAATKSK